MLKMTEREFTHYLRRNPDVSIQTEGVKNNVLTPSEQKAFRKNKRGANRVQFDGYQFDSQLEADRYRYLRQLEATGVIKGLNLDHKKIEGREIGKHRWLIQKAFVTKEGEKVRAITYTDDFQYFVAETGDFIVEDVKGFLGQNDKKSIKLFKARYPDVNFFLNFRVTGMYKER